MNEHEVIGYTTADLVAAMLDAGIHTSVDKFRRLAAEIQRRALSQAALDRMVANAEELGLYDGPAVEIRVIEERQR